MPARPTQGFTLLEVVVALCIFALIGCGSYFLLQGIVAAERRLEERTNRLAGLQRWLIFGGRDLLQMSPCGLAAAPAAGEGADAADASRLAFCRRGRSNPLGAPRSELVAVEFRLDNGRLVRRAWGMPAGAKDTPRDTELMGGVRAFTARFLDDGRQQQEGRPMADGTSASPMIEISVDIESLGVVRQLIPVASTANADAH